MVETASMNAQETAEYCRRRGLYPEQLERWRHDCEQTASLSYTERQREADEAKQQRKRIKTLKKELARKNAVLAETAALLTLRKKRRRSGGRGELPAEAEGAQLTITGGTVLLTESGSLLMAIDSGLP
ncbi:hypothetical protein GCM10027172_24240 [Halomonas garicola]